jgi:hypothetical protein
VNKITLDDIVDLLDNPHKYGDYIACNCNFHDDSSPSMLVYENTFFCKACGMHGSLEYLYRKLSGFDTVSKVKIPVKPNRGMGLWRKWLYEFEDVPSICKEAHKYLVSAPSPYLRRRKIQSVVQSSYIGLMNSFFIFPVFDKEHKIIGAVARASPTIQTKEVRFSVSPDCNALYVPDWKRVLESEYLIVVFGIFDALGLSICGFPVVTGISGASFNADLLDEFRKPIYVIPDKGEERQALSLISQLDWRGSPLFLDFPDECKDTADIREKFDDETLITLIRRNINATEMDSKFRTCDRISIGT